MIADYIGYFLLSLVKQSTNNEYIEKCGCFDNSINKKESYHIESGQDAIRRSEVDYEIGWEGRN